MNCRKCNAVILPTDHFCEECGTPLVEPNSTTATSKCQKCGSLEIDPQGYCINCGLQNKVVTNRLIKVKTPYLAGSSDPGLSHKQNEDFFDLAEINAATAVLVVCDGVSSSQTPELASKTGSRNNLSDDYKSHRSKVIHTEQAIKSAIATALSSICDLPYNKSEQTDPPSTTLVAAIVQNGIATIGSLGDSRAYWISPQGSHQLTKDDSWLTDIVESGQMSVNQAQKSPLAHAITRWLGADAREDAEPKIVTFPIKGSGHLLLCTDGLWNYAPSAQELASLIYRNPNLDAACAISDFLIEFARSKGGHDNITVAIWSN